MHTDSEQSRLISTMAFALRHEPARFDLCLDEEGWTSFAELVSAIRFERYDWAFLDETLVRSAIAGMDRFELRNGMIRATYGHSVELGKLPPIATPPSCLFHGTSSENIPSILQHGILRMRRRFAHFSSDFNWVMGFLADKPNWTIFAVDAERAREAGIAFRNANHHVWLADAIPPQFLIVHSHDQGTVPEISPRHD